MAENRQAPLAVVPLTAGSRVVVEAVNPADGTVVSGVNISQVVISGETITDAGEVFIEVGAARLIPGPGA